MKVSKNSKINFLVKTLIDDENILSLKPVIAGGFMTDMYNIAKLYDTSDKWNNFKNKFKKDPYLAHDSKFSDIDIYLLDNNIIFDKKNKYNWLLDNNDINRSEMESTKNFQAQDNIFNFKTGVAFPRANSFIRKKFKSKSESFQFVLYPQKSVKKILETFDIVNCTIAWHNDMIYYHDSLEHTFLNRKLELTEMGKIRISSGADLYRRIFTSLRIFKYIDRHNLKLSDKIFDTVITVLDDYKNFDFSSQRISGPRNILIKMSKQLRWNLYGLLLKKRKETLGWTFVYE